MKNPKPSGQIALWICLTGLVGLFSSRLGAADPAPLELIQTIDIKGPTGKLDHFALDTKRDYLLVANQTNNSLDIVDLKAGKLLKQIPGQKDISGVAFAAALDRIFVGNSAGGVCNIFDGGTHEMLKSLPLSDADNVRFDVRTGLVFVGTKSLPAIDAKTMTLKKDIAMPGSPRAFRTEPDRARLYSNTSSGVVCVVDTDKLEITARYPIKMAGGNYALALDPANHRIFVGCRKEPILVVLDSETGREITSLAIPGDVDDLAYDAKRKRIYASCGEGFLVVIQQIDADHYTQLVKIPTAKLARTSLFDSDTGRLFLGVPRQEGKDGPEIRVYRATP